MPLYSIGRAQGFPCRTYTHIKPSEFLLDFGLEPPPDKWRSPITLNLIERDLREFTNHSTRPTDNLFSYAVSLVKRKFMLPQPVNIIHLRDVFRRSDLDVWNRSPGLPWALEGYKKKAAIRDDPHAVNRVRLLWHRIKHGEHLHFPDSCAYTRSHITEIGSTKARAVWGYPATILFGETVFALPLIEGYSQLPMLNRPIAYGYETFNGGARRILERFHGPVYCGIDFKKFDKTVPDWLIDIAFDILFINSNFTFYQDHGVADAKRMIHMFRQLQSYFKKTKIILANGKRFLKTTGIASGSYFTQLVGSICNAIVVNYVCLRLSGSPPKDDIYLGDDSFISFSKLIDFDDAQSVVQEIGMELNMAKTQQSRHAGTLTFLGYTLNTGFPTKPFSDWMASLMLSETPDRDWNDIASRATGLYYASACLDREFSRICYSIVHLQKFDIELSRGMERTLIHMGIQLKQVLTDLPGLVYFVKRLLG